jgi:hypothetical protein
MTCYVFHPDLDTNTYRIKVNLIINIDVLIIINLINISVKFELIYS